MQSPRASTSPNHPLHYDDYVIVFAFMSVSYPWYWEVRDWERRHRVCVKYNNVLPRL